MKQKHQNSQFCILGEKQGNFHENTSQTITFQPFDRVSLSTYD
jgi:hypothetical protein